MTSVKALRKSWVLRRGDCRIVIEVDYEPKKPRITIRPQQQESFYFDTVMGGETIERWKNIVTLIDDALEYIKSTAQACDDEIV